MTNTPRKTLRKKEITLEEAELRMRVALHKATPRERKQFLRLIKWKLGMKVKLTADDRKTMRFHGWKRTAQAQAGHDSDLIDKFVAEERM